MKRRKGEEGEGKEGVKCKRWRLKKGVQKKRKKKKARWEREAPWRRRGFGEIRRQEAVKTREKMSHK